MIDASVVETFQTEGAVALRGLLDPVWIDLLRAAMPEILHGAYDPTTRMITDGGGPAATLSRDGIWRECEPFARLLFRSPLGGAAAVIMQSSTARLYEDLLLYKPAGGAGVAGWHRDSVDWPLRGEQLSSIWFSLEPVTGDTGAMRFVAGSHRDEQVDVASISLSEADIAHRRTITIEAEPGDAVVFHPRIAHTAYGSAPDRPRRTFTIRFLGDDVRWRPRRTMFHPWMADCGLQKGDVPDHPWFPVLGRSTAPVAGVLPAFSR